MGYQSFTSANFSGGITDNPKIGDITTATTLDNFNILDDVSIESRSGSELLSTDIEITRSPNGQRINTFFTLNEKEFFLSGRRLYKYNESEMIEILGDTGNKAFDTGDYIDDPNEPMSKTVHFSFAEWRNHMFITNDKNSKSIKVFYDGITSSYKVLTSGLPEYTTDPTMSYSANTNSYIYALVFVRPYNVNNVLFEDWSSTHFKQITDGPADISADNVTLSVFQTIDNSDQFNYGLADIKVKIFRTIKGGQNFHLVGETDVNSGANIVDTLNDNDLQTMQELYINGGVLDYDQPIPSKYVEIVNNVGYYGNFKDKPYRIMYSSVDPDSVPGSFYVDLDDDITGLTSVNKIMIAFTKKSTYRLEGSVDSLGMGMITAVLIDSAVGCVSDNSIAKSTYGSYFAGNTGFCFTDGYKLIKISDKFNETYSSITKTIKVGDKKVDKARQIIGRYDKIEKKMYFACQKNDNSLMNDSFFIFYERYGIKQTGTFATWSGISFNPIAMHINNDNEIIRSDIFGYIYIHKSKYRSDISPNYAKALPEWGHDAIIWEYVSSELDGGNRTVRKWWSKIAVRSKNISNLSLQPSSANDGLQSFKETGVVNIKDQLRYNTPYVLWEDAGNDYKWENARDINHIRYIAKNGLRSYTKQIKLTNGFVEIEKSDDMCTGEVSVLWNTDIYEFADNVKMFHNTILNVVSDDNTRLFLCENNTLYIDNGGTFGEITSPLNGDLHGVGYVNGEFAVIGQHNGTESIAFSPLLPSWDIKPVTAGELNKIKYKDGVYVVIGKNGSCYNSTNKNTWNLGSTGFGSNNINDICVASDKIYIVGDNGKLSVSSDGENWFQKTTGTTKDLLTVASDNSKVITMGKDGIALFSVDDDLWTIIGTATSEDIKGLEYIGFWIYVANNGEYGISYDGTGFDNREINSFFNGHDTNGIYEFEGNIYVFSSYNSYHAKAILPSILKVTLTNTDYFWDKDSAGYYISFEDDEYTKDYLITDVIDDATIRIFDNVGRLINGTKKWIIRGIPKNEIVNIISYNLYYNIFSENFDTYSSNASEVNE